jgi:REP element-mobilizing transposase RayT
MPRNAKTFVSGTLVELGARVEEGLPFVPNNLTMTLVTNVLARAQTFYPVTIVTFVMMRNHFHTLIVVQDPSNVPKFIEYFKRETAYYVNRLLGKRKHTVWCQGYDSPVILDSETAIRRFKYIYLNPVTAKLCKQGKDWPLSSANWKKELTVKRIPRDKVRKLPNRPMTLVEINRTCSKLQYRGQETYTLKIEEDAWMKCFTETKDRDQIQLKDYLNLEIKKEEEKIEREREYPVPDLSKLAIENIRKQYQPIKFGKRMICLGSSKEIRVKFLDWYKTLCKLLPKFLKKTKDEVLHRSHYPPGFFSPGGFLSSNLIPSQTPFAELG